jgi:hypothetical protein
MSSHSGIVSEVAGSGLDELSYTPSNVKIFFSTISKLILRLTQLAVWWELGVFLPWRKWQRMNLTTYLHSLLRCTVHGQSPPHSCIYHMDWHLWNYNACPIIVTAEEDRPIPNTVNVKWVILSPDLRQLTFGIVTVRVVFVSLQTVLPLNWNVACWQWNGRREEAQQKFHILMGKVVK